MARQASINSNGPKQRIRAGVLQFQSFLKPFPEQLTRHVILHVDEGRLERELEMGPLCEMMVPPRGRLEGGGYVASVLLKILIVAYLEAKDDRLSINLAAWQRAAEQDPSTPDLRTAIRGHERQLSDTLVSLFQIKPKGPRSPSPFTNCCRPCVEAMIEPEAIAQPNSTGGGRLPREIACVLFGKSLVETLTSKSPDAQCKAGRANALYMLGRALQHKVEFLKNGRCKNG
jgi:hypothetical protein